MKKDSLIIILVIAVSVVLFCLFSRNDDNANEEKIWYAKNLDYDFCGTIVNRQVLEQKWGYGYAYCIVKSKVDDKIEDSLNLNLKFNESLRFLKIINNNRVELLVQGISNIVEGDSICVSHFDNSVKVYRKGVLISNQKMYKNLRDKWFK